MIEPKAHVDFMLWGGVSANAMEREDWIANLEEVVSEGVGAIKVYMLSGMETFRDLVTEMREAGTRTLLVDVRQNSGGNSFMSNILVYFLYGRETLFGRATALEARKAEARLTWLQSMSVPLAGALLIIAFWLSTVATRGGDDDDAAAPLVAWTAPGEAVEPGPDVPALLIPDPAGDGTSPPAPGAVSLHRGRYVRTSRGR